MERLTSKIEGLVKQFPVSSIWLYGEKSHGGTFSPAGVTNIAVIFWDEFNMGHRDLAVSKAFASAGLNVDARIYGRKRFADLVSSKDSEALNIVAGKKLHPKEKR